MGVDSSANTPMKAWSPRLEAKASREPSGDHSGFPLLPLAENIRLAADEPSMGTTEIWLLLTKATTSPLGETTGSSPSASNLGVPPANGTDQTWIFGATGSDAGLGGAPAQLLP